MGSHTFDCDFCGGDYGSGISCCAKAAKARRKKEAAELAKANSLRDRLRAFGLDVGVNVAQRRVEGLWPEDVLAALERAAGERE